MKTIYFGDIPVGSKVAPILLPDIDMFFNRDLAVAETVIKKLVSSKVNVIKGAVIHSAAIALDDGSLEAYYSPETGTVTENYRGLMERKVMSLDEHEALFKLCRQLGPELVLSVYDLKGAAFAKDVGACALKIPSTNITHEPLIRALGRFGLPVLLDTGKSTLEEIARAVQWAQDGGASQLIIEHSPEAPPASLANHNLRMLSALQEAFDCPVGLSDHHAGDEMMFAAIALGACVIEKGVCADEQGFDQDVHHAMRVSDVEEIWGKCLNIHEALGSKMRYLERDRPKPTARMGLVALGDLKGGEAISLETVDFAFPAKGIPTEYWSLVEGWTLKHDKAAGKVIGWDDLEPTEH
jgi:sialic acid synthase SpsE